jgi:hypothetical protein
VPDTLLPDHEFRRVARDVAGMNRGDLALLPSARMIEEFIRAIPKGKAVSITEMRQRLARRHGADVTCPVYTGYRLRAVAEAACEARANGARQNDIPPVWRVLDETAATMKKLSAEDAAWIKERRSSEGIERS